MFNFNHLNSFEDYELFKQFNNGEIGNFLNSFKHSKNIPLTPESREYFNQMSENEDDEESGENNETSEEEEYHHENNIYYNQNLSFSNPVRNYSNSSIIIDEYNSGCNYDSNDILDNSTDDDLIEAIPRPDSSWLSSETNHQTLYRILSRNWTKPSIIKIMKDFGISDLKMGGSGGQSQKKDVIVIRLVELLEKLRISNDRDKYNEIIERLNDIYLSGRATNSNKKFLYIHKPLCQMADLEIQSKFLELCKRDSLKIIKLPFPLVIISRLSDPIITCYHDKRAFPLILKFEFPSKIAIERNIPPDSLQAKLVIFKLNQNSNKEGQDKNGKIRGKNKNANKSKNSNLSNNYNENYRLARGRRIWNSVYSGDQLRCNMYNLPYDITSYAHSNQGIRFADLPLSFHSFYPFRSFSPVSSFYNSQSQPSSDSLLNESKNIKNFDNQNGNFNNFNFPSKPYYIQIVETINDPIQWHLANRPPLKSNFTIKKEMMMQYNKKRSESMDVETSLIKLSLQCPYSLGRMEIPLRTVKCHHLNCFDMKSWVLTENRNKFRGVDGEGLITSCLVCNVQVRRKDELFVDGFTMKIIESTDYQINQVVLNISTGTWSISTEGGMGMGIEEGGNDCNHQNWNGNHKCKQDSHSHSERRKNQEIIDLTMMSDTDNYDPEKWELASLSSSNIVIKPDPMAGSLLNSSMIKEKKRERGEKRSFNVILLSSSDREEEEDSDQNVVMDGTSIRNAIIVE